MQSWNDPRPVLPAAARTVLSVFSTAMSTRAAGGRLSPCAGRTTAAPTSSSGATTGVGSFTTVPTTLRRSSAVRARLGITPLMFRHAFSAQPVAGWRRRTCPREPCLLLRTRVREILRRVVSPPGSPLEVVRVLAPKRTRRRTDGSRGIPVRTGRKARPASLLWEDSNGE